MGLVATFSEDLVEEEVQIHLILIGHTGVGKTSLRKHLKNESIDMNECPTIVMEPEFLYRESIELSTSIPFKRLKDALNHSKNKVFLSLWDTGGQPIFQDLLPCFARLKCMYGIVFRLPDLTNFDNRPDIRPCSEHESVVSPFTNKDIVYRNLAYVQAFSYTLQDKQTIPGELNKAFEDAEHGDMNYPAAVVVGTCKDIVPHSDQDLIEVKKKELDAGISHFVRSYDVTLFSAAKKSFIHEIDNTKSGTEVLADQGIDTLRDNISQCAQQSKSKLSKSLKLFEVRLQRLCYTDYINQGIVPLAKAIAIGKECNVSNPEAALMYFHELGTFMWYHLSQRGSLRNFIVIDSKVLLELLANFFCLSTPADSKALLDKGLMTTYLFQTLLRQKASDIDDSWFMLFLEEHHLSIQVFQDKGMCHYFLPSILATRSDYEQNLSCFSSEDISPLYIVPHSGYIATGMFTRLLTALAGVTYGSTVWRIPISDGCLREVCRNQFEFVVNESVHIILSEFSTKIRIDCVPYNGAALKDDLFFFICSTLDVQLQRIVPRWIKHRGFDLTCMCTNNKCSLEEHFLAPKTLSMLTNHEVECTKGVKSLIKPAQARWFTNNMSTSEKGQFTNCCKLIRLIANVDVFC